jgi:hypothetical protein
MNILEARISIKITVLGILLLIYLFWVMSLEYALWKSRKSKSLAWGFSSYLFLPIYAYIAIVIFQFFAKTKINYEILLSSIKYPLLILFASIIVLVSLIAYQKIKTKICSKVSHFDQTAE